MSTAFLSMLDAGRQLDLKILTVINVHEYYTVILYVNILIGGSLGGGKYLVHPSLTHFCDSVI